ncbi:DUF1049 domain-containing protein [bacterium]|nr:DUF1049 domain-containing protein [bacterium]
MAPAHGEQSQDPRAARRADGGPGAPRAPDRLAQHVLLRRAGRHGLRRPGKRGSRSDDALHCQAKRSSTACKRGVDVWVIRLVFFVLLLFLLVYVFVTNAGQTVDLRLFGREFLDLGLFWIVSVSVVLGVLATVIGMGLREFRLRRERARLRRERDALQRELDDLRSLPLQELAGDAPAKEQ